jgi:hypothetical protein
MLSIASIIKYCIDYAGSSCISCFFCKIIIILKNVRGSIIDKNEVIIYWNLLQTNKNKIFTLKIPYRFHQECFFKYLLQINVKLNSPFQIEEMSLIKYIDQLVFSIYLKSILIINASSMI